MPTVEVASGGVLINKASVTINETETDLTNNDDKACVSIPIEICEGELISVQLIGDSDLSNYQWYKDGVAIDGAVTDMYLATEIGEYSYTTDGAGPTGDCMGELCCPVVIVEVSCCVPLKCIPVTIIINE